MKAVSALRQAFSAKSNEVMVRKFSPEQLKRIEEAMRMYAEEKCKEQRTICQFDFEQAYEEDEDVQRNDALINMYELNSLQNDSETPEMD